MTRARLHEPWILAVDAVSSCCALALAHGHWLRGAFYSHSPLTLSRRLLAAIEILLSNVECSIDQIRLVALNRGPGSFTSLRITLATLMAFRVRTPFRVLASDTLTLQVVQWSGEGEVWSMIPAGRTEFALAQFRKTGYTIERLTDIVRGTWYQVYPLLQGNDLPILYPEPGVVPMAQSDRVIRIHERHRVEALLWLAQQPNAMAQTVEIGEVTPLYLRPPDIRTVTSIISPPPSDPKRSAEG